MRKPCARRRSRPKDVGRPVLLHPDLRWMHFRPVFYISAVPEELHTARDQVCRTLLSLGCRSTWAPGSEPNLPNDALFARQWRNLRASLGVVFARSVGAIQIVGHCHGKALEQPDKEFGLVSRTHSSRRCSQRGGARGCGTSCWTRAIPWMLQGLNAPTCASSSGSIAGRCWRKAEHVASPPKA